MAGMEKLFAWAIFLTIFSLFAADVYTTQTKQGIFESLYAYAIEEKNQQPTVAHYQTKPVDCEKVAAALLSNRQIPEESKRIAIGVTNVLGATTENLSQDLETIDTYMAYTECFDYLY
jgi:hypothetical protein